jgi:alkanesulfonate monooxygenase SsuD/methylene tetrahydromethanopterin reductase-like flavin-dependent oxidoreductase (luciferase family)
MDVSLMYELETNDNSEEGVRRCYAECLEEVQLADSLRFKTVWFTEHHFLDRFSYSSAPEIFLSYIAAHTRNIRLGHGIVLLPFRINHPLRVAERIAVLDIVSNGRVNFGGGRAISDSELSAFGVDPDVTRPQWLETLKMLPRMWMDEEFSWDSELIKIPPRMVIPKPVQKPHPPMFVSCTQPSTMEIAADHGLGTLGFGVSQDRSNEYVKLYKERIKQAKPVGGFVTDHMCQMVPTMCAPTDEEALAARGPDILKYGEAVSQLFAPWIDNAPASYSWFMEHWKEQHKVMREASVEDIVAAGGAIIGSPATVLERMNFYADAGVDEVMCFMQSYTTKHDDIMRSIRLIGEEVIPKVKPTAVVI